MRQQVCAAHVISSKAQIYLMVARGNHCPFVSFYALQSHCRVNVSLFAGFVARRWREAERSATMTGAHNLGLPYDVTVDANNATAVLSVPDGNDFPVKVSACADGSARVGCVRAEYNGSDASIVLYARASEVACYRGRASYIWAHIFISLQSGCPMAPMWRAS